MLIDSHLEYTFQLPKAVSKGVVREADTAMTARSLRRQVSRAVANTPTLTFFIIGHRKPDSTLFPFPWYLVRETHYSVQAAPSSQSPHTIRVLPKHFPTFELP